MVEVLGLTLLFVGTTHCINCTKFKPEWKKLKDRTPDDGLLSIPGYEFTLREYIVSDHDSLPPPLRNVVTFYPFIMLLPTEYLERNLTNTDDNFSLIGEAIYTYRSLKDGRVTYRLGSSVDDSPNMRYARTAQGIDSWVRESAITSIQMLAAKYYPDIDFPYVDSRTRMRALSNNETSLEMFSSPIGKEYRVVSGGVVMCRRVMNVHG